MILLDAPYTYDPGHGKASQDFTHVIIHMQQVVPLGSTMLLRMQYGNVVGGAWEACGGPLLSIKIQNTAAVTALGPVPQTEEEIANGDPQAYAWSESVAADPAYDNLRDGFTVSVDGADIAVAGIAASMSSPASGYDMVACYLYQYLIDEGYYAGTIV